MPDTRKQPIAALIDELWSDASSAGANRALVLGIRRRLIAARAAQCEAWERRIMSGDCPYAPELWRAIRDLQGHS